MGRRCSKKLCSNCEPNDKCDTSGLNEEYQIIIPEEAESLANSQSPVKASMEKPIQVSGQPPQVV
ncbi:hypothetical protein F2Q70_00007273 [Brassica cretica]|uniref:Uncharacterized protein n=1 Tax=Brassica cretica TaxID=69181 RepID=A0A8S9M494_BRACR|nr:hypothetical protein F2Q68_00000335 [Brassica cretica]KAF2612788.1 hypothetical protein F2Q70_00007273 [Brassica cretica]